MEDGIRLSVYKTQLPNGGQDGPGYSLDSYHHNGDGSSMASVPMTGYETLDEPPNYDFYANTEAWGRQRRARPSLFQLHASPEVGSTAGTQYACRSHPCRVKAGSHCVWYTVDLSFLCDPDQALVPEATQLGLIPKLHHRRLVKP